MSDAYRRVHTGNLYRLALACKLLSLYWELTGEMYGDQELRETDTVKYLNDIDQRVLPVDKVLNQRLSGIRAELTKHCTDEEIDIAIKLAKTL
jgi:hypothetical protein